MFLPHLSTAVDLESVFLSVDTFRTNLLASAISELVEAVLPRLVPFINLFLRSVVERYDATWIIWIICILIFIPLIVAGIKYLNERF